MSLEEDILIERYLKDELDNKERATFEKRLESDSEFRKKVSFEKEMYHTFNENEEELDDLEDYFQNEVKKFQKNIKTGLSSRKKRKKAKSDRFILQE